MKEKLLYFAWLCMYILCAGLGTITERNLAIHIGLTGLSLMFFVPGGILLYDGLKTGNKNQLLRLRTVSICFLALTLVMIVVNILCVGASEAVGNVLNDLLLLVSVPMFCSYWRGVSLFLWAVLFVGSFPKMWKK